MLRRLDNQVSVPLQWPICSDLHAMRTYVVCRGSLGEQRLCPARKKHRKPLGIALFFPILMHGGLLHWIGESKKDHNCRSQHKTSTPPLPRFWSWKLAGSQNQLRLTS